MATGSFVSTRRFFDDKNYPRGFQRSGDFTRQEAMLLEQHGIALKALCEGTATPATEDESQFVDVCHQQRPATTPLEKVWMKYISRTQQRRIHTLCSSSKSFSDNDSEASDYATDLD